MGETPYPFLIYIILRQYTSSASERRRYVFSKSHVQTLTHLNNMQPSYTINMHQLCF